MKFFVHKNFELLHLHESLKQQKKEKKVIDAEQDNWDIQFINAIIYFSCQVVFTLQPVSQEEIKLLYWFSTSRNLPLCHATL